MLTAEHLHQASISALFALALLFAVDLVLGASNRFALATEDLRAAKGIGLVVLTAVILRVHTGLRTALVLWALAGAYATAVLVNLASGIG
jgi:hypothetical protein